MYRLSQVENMCEKKGKRERRRKGRKRGKRGREKGEGGRGGRVGRLVFGCHYVFVSALLFSVDVCLVHEL